MAIKEIIQNCLNDKLNGVTYESDKCGQLTKTISDTIRNRLKCIFIYCFLIKYYI